MLDHEKSISEKNNYYKSHLLKMGRCDQFMARKMKHGTAIKKRMQCGGS